MKSSIFVLLAIFAVAWSDVARYDNYKVYRFMPETDLHLSQLRELQDTGLDLDFWTDVSAKNVPVDIMVAPHRQLDIQEIIRNIRINATVHIDNVQKLIDETTPRTKSSRLDWDNYYTHDEINRWLQEMAQTYPVVSYIEVGKSYEKRNIAGVKVSFGPGRKGVFLEGGIHAREWIGPATVTYILNQILTNKDPQVRSIVESYDWYIFPSVNPDGYVYTYTSNRLWRKTRTPYGLCYGADPNRNWGYHWMDGGASNNPCSDTYAGSSAFSEQCTKKLSSFISTIAKDLAAYIGFHSFSQFLLIPYGHTNQHLDNYNELMQIGTRAKAALARRYGTQYKVGNIVDIIYVASGGSMDWVKGNYKTPITYTFELRDTGRYGFLLPPNQIIPTGQETFDAVLSIMLDAKNNGHV